MIFHGALRRAGCWSLSLRGVAEHTKWHILYIICSFECSKVNVFSWIGLISYFKPSKVSKVIICCKIFFCCNWLLVTCCIWSFAARSSFVVTGFWSLYSPPPEPISASLKAIYMSANLLVALLFHGRLGILTPPWEDWREWLGSLNFSRASFSELPELKLVELSLVVADGPGLCWKSPKSSVSVK